MGRYENYIFGFRADPDGTVCISAAYNDIVRIYKLVAYTLTDLSDLDELGASDNDSVFIDDADNAVDSILHLMDNALKKSVRHIF